MRAAALAIALTLLSSTARATVPLCLEVRADADAAGLEKLTVDELAHHPSHHLVARGAPCDSRLTVELFSVAGARYLTARVNQEVPVRFAVKSARELEERLGEALRQVLRSDPVYLAEDLSRMNAVWRAGANLVRNGTTRYRLELFELVGSGGKSAVFASGGAFTVARGIDHLQVFARLEVAGSPRSFGPDGVVLRVLAGADAGVLWEASARANTTFYVGPGVGLHYARFEGAQAGREANPLNALLFSVALRTGVRTLRFYGFDLDLFAQLHLPLYKSADPDTTLVDAYTPYVEAGLGVGF
jgi:hypothetical protein